MENDPTADFLAREQILLGADAALFQTDKHNLTQHVMDENTQVIQPLAISEQPVAVASPQNEYHNRQDQNIIPSPNLPTSPTKFDGGRQKSQAMMYSNLKSEWQLRFDAKIVERDALEAEIQKATITTAKDNLAKFYAEYSEKKDKTILLNQESSDGVIETKGNFWDRVLKMIEGSKAHAKPAVSRDLKQDSKIKKESAKSVSDEKIRFKQVLISLKNDKNAPGIVVQ